VSRRLPLWQVDAFTGTLFAGNPAAVCLLDAWLPDATLQAIAAENNLSETAFAVPRDGDFALRWFTPAQEVDLCGHATLAAAHVLLGERAAVTFHTRSGALGVERRGGLLAMDFPALPAAAVRAPDALEHGLGRRPREVLRAVDYLVVYDTAAEIEALVPDQERLARLDGRGVIVTAPGTDADFVSRFFAPKAGIPEDPVTGSAHSTLAPYWAARLGKTRLRARQISRRGGELECVLRGDRVEIAGRAVTYLEGTILVP